LYAEKIHVSVRRFSGHSATNDPKATLTMLISNETSITPTDVRTRTFVPRDHFFIWLFFQ